MPNEVTNAELSRRLERIERKLDDGAFASKEAFQFLSKDVDELKTAQTWAFRLMAGAFFGLIVEAVVLILRAQ